MFDRDAIVRAALRAYVEFSISLFGCISWPASARPDWSGDLQRGALRNSDGCGAYDVVAWTEAGVVGLAYELGWGPIEQLGLSVDAVTGGPDDVRGALPGLPYELEPALVMATSMLGVGPEYGQRDAGVGFWLCGDQVAGVLFDDPTLEGVRRLVLWGKLQNGRLPRLCDPKTAAMLAELDRTKGAAMQALVDQVVDRRIGGPTELTIEELAVILPEPLDLKRELNGRRWLQDVGIAWPGSSEQAPR
jgi:hypothetical protein